MTVTAPPEEALATRPEVGPADGAPPPPSPPRRAVDATTLVVGAISAAGLIVGVGTGVGLLVAVGAPVALVVVRSAGRLGARGHVHPLTALVAGVVGAVVAVCFLGARPDRISPVVAFGAVTALAVALFVAARRQVAAGPADEVDRLTIDRRDATAVESTRTRWGIAAMMAVAFGVRLVAPRGLWLDELTSVHQARLSFGDMIDLLYRTDNHPPLHDIVLWLQIRLVGDSELALRLPSMVIGALLVPILFLLGRELFDRRTGLVAAALGVVAPVVVWYGQEARMYALFMVFAALAAWAAARALRTGSSWAWVVLTATSVALVYTQYFAVLFVGALHLVLAFEVLRARRRPDTGAVAGTARRWATSLVVQALLVAPLVPFAAHQFTNNQRAGFGLEAGALATGSQVVPRPSAYTALTNVVWSVWGYQPEGVTTRLTALWPLGLFAVLVLLGRRRRWANRYLAVLALLPAGAVFAASLVASKSRSLAEIRYFAGTAPVLLVLMAAGITAVASSGRARAVLTAAVATSMVLALVVQTVDDDNPRLFGYREAMADIAERAEPGDRVVYTPHYLDYTLEYYSPRVPSSALDEGLPTTDGQVFLVQSAVFADSAETEASTRAAIDDLSEDHELVAVRSWPQITVWQFA